MGYSKAHEIYIDCESSSDKSAFKMAVFFDKYLLGGILGLITATLMGIEFYKNKTIGSVYTYIIIILLISSLLFIEPIQLYLLNKK